MPRPERALNPDLSPLHAFAAELRALRIRAGNPTYQAMARHTGRSRTALSEAAGGDVLPTWDTVVAYVSYCGEDPNRHRITWERLHEHRAQESLHGVGTRDPSTAAEAPADLSNLPRRPTALFLGRHDLLAKLDEALAGADRGLVIGPVVHGLGGIGKTELALQFVHTHRDRFNPVWWISADTVENIASGLAALTRTLEPQWPASASVRDTASWAQRWLATHDGWLLVLDNVMDLAAIQPVLATGSNGRFIATSRRYLDWRSLSLAPFSVPVLTKDVGVDLVMRRTGRKAELADIEGLVDDMGGLPLALNHAAAYLVERPHVATAQYRRWLAEQPTRILSAQALAHPNDERVARTWQVSIEAVAAQDPLASRLLAVIAYLAADRLPVDLFTPLGDELAVEDALTLAASYSLISRSGANVGIHRLVQTVIRMSHHDATALSTTIALLHRALPTDDPEITVAQWRRWAELAPHIDQLSAHLDDDRSSSLPPRQINDAAHVMLRCAFYYRGQGRYETSLALALHSLRLREKSLGSDHLDTVTSRYGAAGCYWSTGRFTEAIEFGHAAMRSRSSVLGPSHPETLEVASNVAVGLRELGQHDEAILLTRQTLTHRERILGPEHPETLRSRNNLAGCYRAVGRTDEAIALHQTTLEARIRVLGAFHPDTLQSQHNLAGSYEDIGRHQDAVQLYEATLAARLDLLGADHPDTSHSRYNLARVYVGDGRRGAAAALLKQTLSAQEWLLGPDHPDTRKTQSALARISPSPTGLAAPAA